MLATPRLFVLLGCTASVNSQLNNGWIEMNCHGLPTV